ncbi:ribonucleoside-triphosphate reductase, adenosylcobalamin-dependent [Limosilactobacillus caccae]|uniref:ribonucleoside-triphosphate reductase, adenosylcobalamin-dependent n=1 Tax=Limosilactobacillus caccae TaxID=1926284 RepID=UPI00097111A4|nr:ribonucleoside-triphosphate reductase, adenosylcobalamin-dependent [Limosilactobacillus caccae]
MQRITLSKQFIAAATKTITPHWGPLGWVTYKRTYARWIAAEDRTEEWAETVQRVIEGNINLDPRLTKEPSPAVINELTTEAQELFKLIYGLGATPSGRNLWISGTDYQHRTGDSLNNCWFIAIRPQKYGVSHIQPRYLTQDQVAVSMPFAFLFDELMKGGGVGFSVTDDNVQQIPAVDNEIKLDVVIDKASASYEESLEAGAIDCAKVSSDLQADESYYKLPDTREGWVLAVAQLIDLHFNSTNQHGIKHLILDMSDIRPRGTKIHGFGGTASGPMPLIEMLYDINNILNEQVANKLSAVDCTDICNLIGKAVVAGNVRRSAELALGSGDNDDFITMKQDQEKLQHHRWASNNSISIDNDFNQYQEVADSIQHNGEPGIVDLNVSKNYGRIADGYQAGIDSDVEGTNPCGEISLANGEPCNLFEIFPLVAEKQGWDLKEAFRLGTRFTKRVTFSHYDWEVSRKMIQKNRRIGISMSGIQDWILSNFGNRVVTGFTKNDDGTMEPVYDQRVVNRVNDLYQAVIDADKEYSKELDCNLSVKHTTVKPSGTVAKLAGVSEGMHFHYAGYLIQRIRFQDTDPLLDALKQCGYRMEPDIYTKHTTCVEFPVKAANADSDQFASAGSISIAEQFATQAFLQKYWSDNAVSCTITFQDKEADQIPTLLKQYRSKIKSTSLLPYYGGALQQAPKEPIDKQTYEKRQAMISDDVMKVFAAQQEQDKALDLVDQSDCAGGACPIR